MMRTQEKILARICTDSRAYKLSYDKFQIKEWNSARLMFDGIVPIQKDEYVLVIPDACNGIEYQCVTNRGIYWISTRDFEYV